jgi:two-component system sensor histidine kinase BarA
VGFAMSRKISVLSVDDNDVERYALERHLQNLGFVVTSVSGGADAIQEASEREFDVVLLDVNMPEVGGFEVCQSIRDSEGLQPAIIFHSATHASAPYKDKAMSVGGDAFLTFPMLPEHLLPVIHGAIAKRSGQSGS